MTRQRESQSPLEKLDEAARVPLGGGHRGPPFGWMNGQTQTARDGWKLGGSGGGRIDSYLFFGCLPPFRGTFKAVLPMYIFFMVCLCSFPLMCLQGV